MAFPIPPQTFRCQDCQWKKNAPYTLGDVRIPGVNHVDECPRCGSHNIRTTQASTLDLTIEHLRKIARKS